MSTKCRLEIDSMETKKFIITFLSLYIDGTFLQVLNICYINANNKEKYTVFISQRYDEPSFQIFNNFSFYQINTLSNEHKLSYLQNLRDFSELHFISNYFDRLFFRHASVSCGVPTTPFDFNLKKVSFLFYQIII